MARAAGKRGAKPYRRDSILLKFGDYLVRAKLPVLPKSFGHVSNTEPDVPGGWGMLGNDNAGNCVDAGGEHETMLFAMATGRPIPTFTNTSLKNYSAMLVAQGGLPYDANNPDTDTGLDIEQAAKYRRDIGLLDDSGIHHKISAYALVSDVDELEIATYCFGVAGLGLSLPDSADDQFNAGHIWDDMAGNQGGGHYPPCFGFNSAGNLVLSTWGGLQGATKGYVTRYWNCGIAYLSQEYMMANGRSPELIDWAGLQDDLSALTA